MMQPALDKKRRAAAPSLTAYRRPRISLLNAAALAVLATASALPAAAVPQAGHTARGGTTMQKYAVIVGINDYHNAAPTLRYAVADSRRLYQTLIDPHGGNLPKDHIALLTSDAADDAAKPTRDNVLAAVRDIAARAKAGDQFWFYFAGHGIQLHGYSYLVTQGFALKDMDHTALSTHELRDLLETSCHAHEKILVLDACESGSPRSLTAANDATTDPAPPKGSGEMITMTACDENQSAYEFDKLPDGSGGGEFTYVLVEGLRGAADADHNGTVSASEIKDYVTHTFAQEMARHGIVQTPQFMTRGLRPLQQVYLTRDVEANASQADIPDDAHLQTKAPLPPTLIVMLSGQGDAANAAAATSAENEVIAGLMQRGYLIADTQAAELLHNLNGDQQMAQAAAKRGAHFLVVGVENTSLDSLEPPLVTATTTLSVRIVDEQGNVMATAKAVSGPHAAGTAAKAEADAISEAADRLVDALATTVVRQALGIKP